MVGGGRGGKRMVDRGREIRGRWMGKEGEKGKVEGKCVGKET